MFQDASTEKPLASCIGMLLTSLVVTYGPTHPRLKSKLENFVLTLNALEEELSQLRGQGILQNGFSRKTLAVYYMASLTSSSKWLFFWGVGGWIMCMPRTKKVIQKKLDEAKQK